MPGENASPLTIYLLDVGTEKYGDCLICELGERRILIDGAHAGDFQKRGNRPSIPDQMKEIFKHDKPFQFDLLVVTHCHADHIGCLPTLVSNGTIKADAALVADETLGFGRSKGDKPPSPDALTTVDRLAAALREEDYTHLNDVDLARTLEDIATLESRYSAMLAKLKQDKTQIVRYGSGDHKVIEKKFKDFGLKVLGPTKQHLQLCAKAIGRFNDQAAGDAARVADTDLVTLYRSIVGQADAAGTEDKPGKGAALNDQSIVLQLNAGGATALLAGDMQFAKPEVAGVDKMMSALRAKVKKAGPYRFIKLTHHSSYNGFDHSILQEWTPTTHFAHTGGLNDANHPDPGVLQILEEQEQALKLQWARTDRNGKITVTFPSDGLDLAITFGSLNDGTVNTDAGMPAVAPAAAEPGKTMVGAGRWEIPAGKGPWKAEARMEWDGSKFTAAFDIAGGGAEGVEKPAGAGARGGDRGAGGTATRANYRLAGGRELPKLLFITYRPRLENNLGVENAQAALQLIVDGGQTLYEVQRPDRPLPEVRAQLQKDKYAGVVIVGGYDVLPSQRLDVLPASLRSQVQASSDSDYFIVWNDEAYGDRDGDQTAELPVSRIPDAKTPRLVRAALTTTSAGSGTPRFGVRNVARPFATGIYALLPGTAPLLISAPTSPASVGTQGAKADVVYFMLHGSDEDGSRFWGEDGGGMVEAVDLSNVPRVDGGGVFAGCCWGALTVDRKASAATPGQPLGIRTPGQSMALAYLHAGARAFVGCTGTHYSPTQPPYNFFGGPMHQAFFKRLLAGAEPAQALFEAKVDYRAGLPHGQNSNVGKAIEYKIWKEFTCLGLGW